LASLAAFVVASGTILLLIAAAAVLTASGQKQYLTRLRSAGPSVKTWSAYILLVVGIWFVALAVFARFFTDVFPV
jgi:uncharacterized membrane protein YecN with MAPEG domain